MKLYALGKFPNGRTTWTTPETTHQPANQTPE